ncbi:hypothetical protein I7I51_02687 [Histoplasma capsulatum]|uniref:Uncharacterized protein n=1 Tax=Ajellomyces capsulatus TaxID=5037 RepID=A0A8A1ME95_AJECA|nr:predicted protein [Histoplasma mississippiense (nom. inval.)]EDN04241.1 predicted protein [Histoplasma mississippiense (nom. inval.)]QSS62944.1 hypothetical protein I7I51_02687 [Histoplasma capsulatum]
MGPTEIWDSRIIVKTDTLGLLFADGESSSAVFRLGQLHIRLSGSVVGVGLAGSRGAAEGGIVTAVAAAAVVGGVVETTRIGGSKTDDNDFTFFQMRRGV